MSLSRGPAAPFKGPAELVLAAAVARRYYIDGRTKIEIADEFQISRFKVARLLDAARQHDVVRFEIRQSSAIDLDRSNRLREHFGLEHAIVVDVAEEGPVALRTNLGRAAADLLTEVVGVNDVVGLAWARSVQAMADQLRRLPPLPVVQLTGALSMMHGSSSSIAGESSVDMVRTVARVSGGPAYLFFAPFLVPDAATAEAMRRHPDVARAFEKIPSVSVAVVGIGRWAPGQSTLYDAATEREQDELANARVSAELAGVCLRADGEVLQTSLNTRMVAIGGDQLRAVPQVIAIAYSTAKQPAVLAVLRSGLVDMLVTHVSLADALLASSASAATNGQWNGIAAIGE